MSKKIDERIPQNSGEGSGFKNYYGIQSPWNRIYSYQEALHYASRFESVLSAATLQALRIIVPDYAERAQLMCEEAYARLYNTGKYYGDDDGFGIHPFFCGQFAGALIGDKGDIPRGEGAGCLRLGYLRLRALPDNDHVSSGAGGGFCRAQKERAGYRLYDG